MGDRPHLAEARPTLSVVVPVCDEEATLDELYRRTTAVLEDLGEPFELVLVDDGSRDGSLAALRRLADADRRVKVIALSRNFGHQVSITAGLDYARGDAVVVMDGDLQDPPEVIPDLVAQWRAGFDVVYAVRTERAGESWFKRGAARAFYRLLQRLSPLQVPLDTGDFRLLSRRAADELRRIREQSRYLRGLASWVGFRQTGVAYTRDERFAGDTKFGLGGMLRFGLDGITSFSFVPLQLATYVGLAMAVGCLALLGHIVFERLAGVGAVPGWTSIIVVMLFVAGLQFLILGLHGEYIGRIYAEVKRRPLYVVAEMHNVGTRAPADVVRPPAVAAAGGGRRERRGE
jgi:glycosyltransferase involved in cell wall biosynthesis